MDNDNKLPKKTTKDLMLERDELVSQLIELDGELSEELEQRFFANSSQLSSKADNLLWAIERLESEEAFLKSQAKRLTDAAKSRGNQAERIRKRIKELMLAHDSPRISGETVEFYISKSKPKLVGEGNPEGFTKQTILIEPDRDAIRDAIEDGREVEGYQLEPVFALRTRVNVKLIE